MGRFPVKDAIKHQVRRQLQSFHRLVLNLQVQLYHARPGSRLVIGAISGKNKSFCGARKLRPQLADKVRGVYLDLGDDHVLAHGGDHVGSAVFVRNPVLHAQVFQLIHAVDCRQRRAEHKS